MIRQKKLTMQNQTHPFKSEWNNSKHFLKLAHGHQDLNRNIQTTIWTTMIQLVTTTVFPFCPALAYFALCCSTFVEIKFNKFTSTFCKVIKLSGPLLVQAKFLARVTWRFVHLKILSYFALCVIYRLWRTCGRIYSSKLSWVEPIHGILCLMNPCQTYFFKVWQTLSAKHDKLENSVYF